MYIARIKRRHGEKVYEQILLRQSYRVRGAPRSRVKHRTVANPSGLPPHEIEAIELALKFKNDLARLRELVKEKEEQPREGGNPR